jgi:hypothetical protein
MDDAAARSQTVFDIFRKWYVSIDYCHVGFVGEPKGTPTWFSISAFVLIIDGRWILFTAVHVIQRLKLALSQGAEITGWYLNDGVAGSDMPALPYDPALEKWVAIDDRDIGIDLAFTVLSPLYAHGLASGGIVPPNDVWWLDVSPHDCMPWFVFGTPSETIRQVPGRVIAHPTMIPIEPLTELPEEARSSSVQLGSNLLYAQLSRSSPPKNLVPISDLDGMSGGPVIGLRRQAESGSEHDTLHIVGIQSGWLPRWKILTVSTLQGVLEAINAHLSP